MHELAADTEHEGELARHLATTGAEVEILEHDPEPETASEPDPEGGDGQPPAEPVDPSGLDIAGTIDTVLSWVGEDPARARHALEVEQARDGARATLVNRLQQLAGPVVE
ncbi:hypothetical protein C7C46_08940 [Streptomyces tateyamensis]|uniref:Uncharacterized protein n=2 Tax=Streptomyces tateyamensis TaxID=565073 RepID=A0A2V4NQH5_9ACTN|nr:hypothetical protein C7C46_08940 [Streptomyces tateyamensis]